MCSYLPTYQPILYQSRRQHAARLLEPSSSTLPRATVHDSVADFSPSDRYYGYNPIIEKISIRLVREVREDKICACMYVGR